MGDSLTIVAVIVIGIGLMFGIPLLASAQNLDEATQVAVQTATTEFGNKIATTARFTLDDYQKYQETLNGTKYTYATEFTIQRLDENPGVKTTQAESTKIGENVYYTLYTSQVEQELFEKGRINLKKGDIITITVKNTNITFAESLKNMFYRLSGNDTPEITTQWAGVCTEDGSLNRSK